MKGRNQIACFAKRFCLTGLSSIIWAPFHVLFTWICSLINDDGPDDILLLLLFYRQQMLHALYMSCRQWVQLWLKFDSHLWNPCLINEFHYYAGGNHNLGENENAVRYANLVWTRLHRQGRKAKNWKSLCPLFLLCVFASRATEHNFIHLIIVIP